MSTAPFQQSLRNAFEIPISAQVNNVFFETLIDKVPSALVLIDRTTRIRAFSPSAERLFGHSLRDALGQCVATLFSPSPTDIVDEISSYFEAGNDAIVNGEKIVGGMTSTGMSFAMSLYAGSCGPADNPHLALFARDLSARQTLQGRIDSLQAEFAHLGRMSQACALSAAVAHDFKQPLSAISTYVESAIALLDRKDGDATDVARNALERCEKEVLVAERIMDRWRRFLRGGSPERIAADVESIVREALAFGLSEYEHGTIAIEMAIDANLPDVYVGPIEIQQVLVALFRNAVEAMAETDAPAIIIGTRRAETDGVVEICVSDNGTGIDRDLLDRLFHPLETNKTTGLGIGLSISRLIVESHGGRIWAVNSPSGGAAFSFTLPARGLDS